MKGKILLTGYEPFLDMKRNPSMEAIRLLEGMEYNGYEVVIEEMPMKYAEVRDIIRGLVDKHQPAAVICTGVSSIATDIPVERVAINVGSADGRVNFGYERLDQALNPDGPTAYWSTLPVREIVEKIKDEGIPAHISNSAGTQGCNLVFYHLMDYIAEKNLGIPGGFIHVPRLPENAVGSRNPSMSLLDSAKALEIAADLTASKLP
ncbi:pyroglutamyl-peptidase I [Candidatus Bathyarchaeota archaeon]|jgi:pyroglutamyl-peptidase|nr:pyroglutamyl-peptidase I [Candidatus Bathyarchaeota archaeon]MBT4321218.1 pyroglutamyl-peptidase I [Candidatus Bathyarchaeota archaeon]MBT4423629.1 pyroglutamyl-peptidase I [Candidatus Bathyarchaeota archaeon]MBT5642080.1 pyroglutamyl-peptidase I [Candidatus Bathyarchaeota archaeon]MBT6605810.1 pyroglutamyl-peptidase I [Candidatus Bathyarchaeota archaeon]